MHVRGGGVFVDMNTKMKFLYLNLWLGAAQTTPTPMTPTTTTHDEQSMTKGSLIDKPNEPKLHIIVHCIFTEIKNFHVLEVTRF